MIEIIIGAFIGVYIIYINSKDCFSDMWHGADFTDKIGIFALYSAGLVIGAAFGMILAIGVGSFLPDSWVQSDSVNLIALRDNISTTGSFFLGSGSINGELEYYYYIDLGDNAYQSGSLLASRAMVIEDNPKQPQLIAYDHAFEKNWWNLFALDPKQGIKTYEFHIPKGSIAGGYNLNLGK